MCYRISTSDGRQGRALDATYDTRDEAAEALRELMGWDEIALSDPYAVGDGHRTAVSAYPTESECEADEDGAHAPRIGEDT
jgi:hypothetical protein